MVGVSFGSIIQLQAEAGETERETGMASQPASQPAKQQCGCGRARWLILTVHSGKTEFEESNKNCKGGKGKISKFYGNAEFGRVQPSQGRKARFQNNCREWN